MSNPRAGRIALLAVVPVIGLVAWTRLGGGLVGRAVTLAVLPFENLGSDPEREYLASGLTDETSASLAQIDPERLSVKGRTMRYKGSTKTVAEIGQELSVDYLVESSIRAEGGRLRVTARLIRVRDQEYVWSQSYEREPTSLLGLQQELSTAIAEQVRMRLSPDRVSGFGRRQTQNADAYDAYLGAGTSKAGERRRRTRAPSRSTSGRSPSTRTTRWRGRAWRSFMRARAINGDARPSRRGTARARRRRARDPRQSQSRGIAFSAAT